MKLYIQHVPDKFGDYHKHYGPRKTVIGSLTGYFFSLGTRDIVLEIERR